MVHSPAINAALPTGFAHALESWVQAIFWRLRSGLEERTPKNSRGGSLDKQSGTSDVVECEEILPRSGFPLVRE